MFRFHIGAGLSGCCGEWVPIQSVGEERNEYRCLLLCLVQFGTTGKCPSVCCKDFFMAFLKCSSYLCLSSTEHFSLFPLRAVTWKRSGTADAWITVRCWVCCVLNCINVHLAVWLKGENITDWDITQLISKSDSWRSFIGRLRHFCFKWQWHWQWHRWHYWHKRHTVD
jgi:hypothetical protein